MVGAGNLGPFAEFFADGERLLVPLVGLIETAPVLGDDTDLVAGAAVYDELDSPTSGKI